MRHTNPWNNKDICSEECYSAFLDIQGFKNYVCHHSMKETQRVFDTLCEQLDGMREEKVWKGQNDYQLSKYNALARESFLLVMSDSIIIAVEKKHRGALQFIIESCARIQQQMLVQHQILFRGGISEGAFFGNDRITFGEGLVRAYTIEEAPWNKMFRTVLDPKIHRSLKGHRFHCLSESACYGEEKNKIRVVDYFNSMMWDQEVLSILYRYADREYESAKIQGNKLLEEKYHWLLLHLAYTDHLIDGQMRKHEDERIMAMMNFQ